MCCDVSQMPLDPVYLSDVLKKICLRGVFVLLQLEDEKNEKKKSVKMVLNYMLVESRSSHHALGWISFSFSFSSAHKLMYIVQAEHFYHIPTNEPPNSTKLISRTVRDTFLSSERATNCSQHSHGKPFQHVL